MVSNRYSTQDAIRLFEQLRPALASRISSQTLRHLNSSWHNLTLAAASLADEGASAAEAGVVPRQEDRVPVPIQIVHTDQSRRSA